MKRVAFDASFLFFCFCFLPLETTGVALILLCILRYARGEKYLDSAASTAGFIQYWTSLITILVRFGVLKDFVCNINVKVHHL